MKSLKILVLGALMIMAGAAQGQLAGKNVILVHGLQSGDLSNPPASQQDVERNGDAYWQAFWAARAQARIDWSSHERIEGRTAERAYRQMLEISQQGLCRDGCVLVTHSTGDLVARYILENQAHWLRSAGAEPLNILVALDFAGAGGGSELANLAVNAAYSDAWYDFALRAAVQAYLGTRPTPDNLGVLHDLQPAVARNLATAPNSIPRLRFVGGGSQFFGVTAPFLPGKDDGVVALHSACGGTQAGSFNSCVNNVEMNGKRASVSAPRALYHNHFPVLMGDSVNHSAVINTESGNSMTYAYNGLNFGGVQVNFDTEVYQQRAWWQLWGSGDTYQRVRDAERYSMSGLVAHTLNR